MAGQAITRQGDLLGSIPLTGGLATNVYINGKLAGLTGSTYGIGDGATFALYGSLTVLINGRHVHRVGDITEDGPAINGSPNVFAGGASVQL
jgi:uncharacterized Zn-binding protein involved in type VI secretion